MGKFLLSLLCAFVFSFTLGLATAGIYAFLNPCPPEGELACLAWGFVVGYLMAGVTLVFTLIFLFIFYFIYFRNPARVIARRNILLISTIFGGIYTFLYLWKLSASAFNPYNPMELIDILPFPISLLLTLILGYNFIKEKN